MAAGFPTDIPNEWGWFESSREKAALLYRELQKELPSGHILFHKPVTVVAHREATDDILCRHVDEPDRFTLVHLTWLGREEINEQHPTVASDGTFEDFLNYEREFMAWCKEQSHNETSQS